MEKTTIARLAIILFTAAMAAVNIPAIAQPQNNRLDSLKRVSSYEVCKQYLNNIQIPNNLDPLVKTAFSKPYYRLARNVYVNVYRYTIPIARIFPEYFKHKTPDIFPLYTYFTPEYGCPMYVKPKKTTNISEQLDSCRTKLDSIANRIIKIMYADSAYMAIVNYAQNPKTDKKSINEFLTSEEKRIRQDHLIIKYIKPSRRVIKNKHYYSVTSPHSILFNGKVLSYVPGDNKPSQSNRITGLEYRNQIKYVSYIDDYHDILYNTNNCCLALILSDHIRRGVPIDISWIPEQTLAEIEATKPIRQLK